MGASHPRYSRSSSSRESLREFDNAGRAPGRSVSVVFLERRRVREEKALWCSVSTTPGWVRARLSRRVTASRMLICAGNLGGTQLESGGTSTNTDWWIRIPLEMLSAKKFSDSKHSHTDTHTHTHTHTHTSNSVLQKNLLLNRSASGEKNTLVKNRAL